MCEGHVRLFEDRGGEGGMGRMGGEESALREHIDQ